MGHTIESAGHVGSTSTLRSVPPRQRQRLAAMLFPVGLVVLAAGAVATFVPSGTGGALLVWRAVGIVIMLLAVLLLGVAVGLARTARLDQAAAEHRTYEADLDAAINATVAAAGPAATACGTACGSACGAGAQICTKAPSGSSNQ